MHTSDKRAGRRLALFIGCLTIIGLLSAGDRAMVAGADPTAAAGGIHKESAASRLPITNAVQTPDPNTLLLLRFDNSLNGAQGETPTQAAGVSFQPGISGQGAFLPAGAQLHYASAGNLNAKEGTIEFWVKPNWNGNDGQSRTFMYSAGDGTIRIGKDGANNFGLSFWNVPQVAVDINLGQWSANAWRHVAFTWSDQRKRLRLYVNGVLMRERSFTASLPSSFPPSFQIGAEIDSNYLDAVLDEFRISDVERTAQEIADHFTQSLTISNWSLNPATSSIELWPTWYWWINPTLTASTNIGALSLPALAAKWSSSNPAIAAMDSSGRIRALSPGSATLTGTLAGKQQNIAINVVTPARQPEEEAIDPFLATPASGYLYKMPVAIINFLPTRDGINIDAAASGWTGTVAEMKANLARYRIQAKYQLEERSRFRHYSNPNAPPTLGYQVVKIINVYEDIPPWNVGGPTVYQPDYYNILTRFNAQQWVNQLGVKEIWLWGYHYGRIAPVESDMASPTTGDISNSFRYPDDLPVYNQTYVLYNYNFARSDVNVHGQGHQLEAIYTYVNWQQDGNDNLFWNQFCGRNPNGSFQRGRCGNVHFPPNGVQDYDYSNPTPVLSDIEDWTPANTGQKKQVNVDTWRNIQYAWPDNRPPDWIDQANWLLYWMQNMPGRGNTIPYGNNRMTNWWVFTGDWDAAIKAGIGLYEPASCAYDISATSQNFGSSGGTGSVNVTCGGGCKWIASSNTPWITVTTGSTGAGNGAVTFSVAPNSGNAPRAETIAIAGRVFTVTQSANAGAATTVSAASYANALASEAIAAGFGSGLATTTQSATTIPLPTQLSGTTVKVKDSVGVERFAPLFFVSPMQINYQIPPGSAYGTATVAITSGNGAVSTGTTQISVVAPGLFTADASGRGLPAAVILRVKVDGSRSFEPVVRFDAATGKFTPVPIDLGAPTDQVFLVLYATGVRNRSSLSAVKLTVGGGALPAQYAGAQGSFVGLDQVNALLPRSLIGRGAVDVNLRVDNQQANTVQLSIR